MSSPSTHSRPASIFSRWLMQRRSVDLPPPEGPSRTNVCCGCTTKSMPLSTSSLPNDFHTCSALTIGARRCTARRGHGPDRLPSRLLLLPGASAPASRLLRLLVAEASAEVRLQVVLADGEQRREEEYQMQATSSSGMTGSSARTRSGRLVISSRPEITETSEVVLSMEMVSLPMGGMMTRIACGRTMRRMVSRGTCPATRRPRSGPCPRR